LLTMGAQGALGADSSSTLTVNAVLNFSNVNTFKVGTGTLVLTGATANTGTGATFVNEGTLQLNKTANVNAITNNLTIGDNRGGQDVVQYGAAGAGTVDQIGAVTVTVQSTGVLDLATNTKSDTIGALTLMVGPTSSASVQTGTGTLTLGGNVADLVQGG